MHPGGIVFLIIAALWIFVPRVFYTLIGVVFALLIVLLIVAKSIDEPEDQKVTETSYSSQVKTTQKKELAPASTVLPTTADSYKRFLSRVTIKSDYNEDCREQVFRIFVSKDDEIIFSVREYGPTLYTNNKYHQEVKWIEIGRLSDHLLIPLEITITNDSGYKIIDADLFLSPFAENGVLTWTEKSGGIRPLYINKRWQHDDGGIAKYGKRKGLLPRESVTYCTGVYWSFLQWGTRIDPKTIRYKSLSERETPLAYAKNNDLYTKIRFQVRY